MKKVRLDLFDPKIGLDRGVSRPKEILWYFVKIIFFLSSIPYPSTFKVLLLNFFGAKAGIGITIKPRVNIHFPWKLIIDDFVWIGEEVFILNFEKVTIGSHVCISQRAFLCGGNHDFRQVSMPYKNGQITLETGCWVGANVFIGPNVTISSNTIITAGSVMTKSSESNAIYRGNPGELIKKRW